jgi:hypothetical protein
MDWRNDMNTMKSYLTASLTSLALAAGVAYAAPDAFVSEATIAAAKTPAEHEAIAQSYEDEAASLNQKADVHAEMARSYGAPGVQKSPQIQIAKHCAALAKDYRAAARQSAELAAIQRKLAKEGAK